MRDSSERLTIGVIFDPVTPNSYYRATFPLRALERRGHSVVWPGEHDSPRAALAQCDLVHCHRRLDRLDDLRRLSKQGVAISFDNDDNLLDIEHSPGGTRLERHLYNRKLYRLTLEAARLSDISTTTTEPLAEQYRRNGVENVAVVDNYLPRDMFGFGSRAKHRGVTVGWIAAREHESDLRRIPIVEALEGLLDAHPELRLKTAGIALPIKSARYQRIEYVRPPDLLTFTGQLDIGIAPLADTDFNRCRSSVKIKEYGAGGAAWLASPVGPYQALDERQGGRLVEDHEWYLALDALIRAPRIRKRLMRKALKWAKSQTIDKLASAWENVFLNAVERARSRASRPTG